MKQIKQLIWALTGLLSLYSGGYVNAQPIDNDQDTEYLSLEACIQRAMQRNPEIKNARVQTELSRIDWASAKFSRLPNLNAGINHGYNFGRSIDRFTNQFVTRSILSDYFSLNASMPIYNGMNLTNTIKQQRFNYLASLEDLEFTKNQLSLNVASTFLTLLMAKEMVKSMEAQMEATEAQLTRTRKMYEAGSIDISQVLALESQLSSEDLSLVEAQNQAKVAHINLQNLLLFEPEKDWDIVAPELNHIPSGSYDVREVFDAAVKHMPQVKSGTYRVQGAEMGEKAARGLRAPTISLYANMSTVFSENALEITNQVVTGSQPIGFVEGTGEQVLIPTFRTDTRVIPFEQQLRNNFGQTLGVSLSWNIFNGRSVAYNIQRSEFNKEIQQNNLQQTHNALMAEVTRSVTDYNASIAKSNATSKALVASKQQFDFAEKRFENGLMNYFDYINTKNQYTRAQISNVQARYEMVFNNLIVNFYLNNTLTL